MTQILTNAHSWLGAAGGLTFPLLLSLWIAWGDVKTRRIPNYLTLGTALTGLIYQGVFHGLNGLLDGCLGLGLGFALLILPYLWSGMGAGDVKALAALGAWLGMRLTMHLFLYMALCGGLMGIIVLWWRGQLWQTIRQGVVFLVSWVLCRPVGGPPPPAPPSVPNRGLPYGVALAGGMLILFLGGANLF